MSNQEAFAFEDGEALPASALRAPAEDVVAEPVEASQRPADLPVAPSTPLVEIRSSPRRRRTVTAFREGDRTIVLVPARMSRRERERYAAVVERLDKRDARTRRTDDDLMARATVLSRDWLGGRAQPVGVRWVSNQRSRWGSCTPVDGTIRISDRMRGMPQYVVDSVLLHELAHLVHADHGPEFWALLEPHPDQERAKAYLEGAMFGQAHLRDDAPPAPAAE